MKYQQTPNVVARPLGNEVLLVPVKGHLADMRQVFTLNASGEVIWKALAAPVDLDHIVACLAKPFDVPESTAREDASQLLKQLADRGLVQMLPE